MTARAEINFQGTKAILILQYSRMKGEGKKRGGERRRREREKEESQEQRAGFESCSITV